MPDGGQRPGIDPSYWAFLNLAYPTSGQAGSRKGAGSTCGRCRCTATLPGGSTWKRSKHLAWNAMWTPGPTVDPPRWRSGARSMHRACTELGVCTGAGSQGIIPPQWCLLVPRECEDLWQLLTIISATTHPKHFTRFSFFFFFFS